MMPLSPGHLGEKDKEGAARLILTGILLSLFWLVGCGKSSSDLCSNPTPVLGTFAPAAPGYLILYQDGVDAQTETSRLAALYGFQPTSVWSFGGFAATFSGNVLEHLRCEPSI
jgi:hypothetical protein